MLNIMKIKTVLLKENNNDTYTLSSLHENIIICMIPANVSKHSNDDCYVAVWRHILRFSADFYELRLFFIFRLFLLLDSDCIL